MPTVPQAVAPQVSLAPVPEMRIPANRRPEEFGAIEGRNFQVAGELLQDVSNYVVDKILDTRDAATKNAAALQERQDHLDLQNRELDYVNLSTKLLEDPNEGLLTQRTGVNAKGVTTDAMKEFDKFDRELLSATPERLQPELQTRLRVRRTGYESAVSRFEAKEFQSAEDDTRKAYLQTAVSSAAKATNPNDRLLALGQGLSELNIAAETRGWSPETLAHEQAVFKTNLHTGVVQAELVADPTGARARAYFEANQSQIDPSNHPAIVNQFEQIARARAAEAERREAQADRAVDGLEKLAFSGYPLRPQDTAAVSAAVQGTPAASRLVALQNEIDNVSQFAFMPRNAREFMLTTENKRLREVGVTGGDLSRLERYQKMHVDLADLEENDPLAYGVRQGFFPEPPPLNLASAPAMVDSLKARVAMLDGLSKTHQVAPKLLHPNETDALAVTLNQLPPSDRANFLRTLHAGIDDPDYYAATVAQLAPGAPLTAFAGRLATEEAPGNRPLAAAGSASALVLEGDTLLNPLKDSGAKPFPLPKDNVRREEFNAHTGEIFASAPEAYATMRKAVDAAYATLSAQAGDYSAEINEDRYRDAIDRVTGGVVEVNGRRIIKPYLMTEDSFTDTLDAVAAFDVEFLGGVQGHTSAEAAAAVREGELVNYGDGYAVLDGGKYLLKNSGEVFVWRPAATLVRPFRR